MAILKTKRGDERIGINGDTIHLGCYPTKTEAAKAYNDKATELFGEFARLNQL